MRNIRLLVCALQRRHRWKLSKSKPGYLTCVRCLARRPCSADDMRMIEIVAE